jgi:hypothetical protein
MRLKALALVLLAAAAAAPPGAAQEGGAEPPVVRMRDGHGSDLLFKVHPLTLRPLTRPIRTFRNGYGLALSPDGTRLAYTDGSRARSRIHFVDLAGWRSMGIARLGRRGSLDVGWVSENRVVAIAAHGFGRRRLLFVDVRTRKVVARRVFTGMTVDGLSVPGGYALVLGPSRGTGPLRILVAGADGSVRTIGVDRIEAGYAVGERRGRSLKPGIALDREGGRLFVVAARGLLVAEVGLAPGAVSYHALGVSAAKGNVDQWWRDAAWLGDGRLAVSGEHSRPARGRRIPNPVPFGLRIIDTRDWSIRTLDPRPNLIHVAGETVLASGVRWFGGRRPPEATGLLAFDSTGRRAYVRFRGQDVIGIGSRGRLGYVWIWRTRRLHVIDLRDGRTLNEIRGWRRVPFLLLPRP